MLRTNYLVTSAIVVDLKSQHILQWSYHILVVNTAIVKSTMGAPMEDAISCVIRVVALHVPSMSQPLVTVERNNKEFHANLPIDQSSDVRTHAQSF
jgi:hypothetical protein